MINLFDFPFPPKAASLIIEALSPEDKENLFIFKNQNKSIQKLFFTSIESITLKNPKHSPMQQMKMTLNGTLTSDLFVNIVSRYPNLKEIIFGKKGFASLAVEDPEKPKNALIPYFESEKGKKQLSGIERITFQAIHIDKKNEFYQCLFHENLRHVSLKYISNKNEKGRSANLTVDEFKECFTRAVNLQTLKFKYECDLETQPLSLTHLTRLSKIEVLYRGVFSPIFLSDSCEEVVIENFSESSKLFEFGYLFSKVKRLDMTIGYNCFLEDVAELDKLDKFTKHLSSLELLSTNLRNISDQAIEILRQNCPKIKKLKATMFKF